MHGIKVTRAMFPLNCLVTIFCCYNNIYAHRKWCLPYGFFFPGIKIKVSSARFFPKVTWAWYSLNFFVALFYIVAKPPLLISGHAMLCT